MKGAITVYDNMVIDHIIIHSWDIDSVVTLMKGRVSYEDMDYKCSGPWKQISEKSWDMFSMIEGKAKGTM